MHKISYLDFFSSNVKNSYIKYSSQAFPKETETSEPTSNRCCLRHLPLTWWNHGSSDELSVRSPRPQQQQHHLFLTWKIRPRREPFKKRHHKKRWTRCEVCRRILLWERLVRRRYRYLYQQVSRRHNSSDVAGLLHSSEI